MSHNAPLVASTASDGYPPESSPSSSLPSSTSSSRSSSVSLFAIPKAMIKLWPSIIADQLTPRANPDGRERPNPFDVPPGQNASLADRSGSMHNAASGMQTPTLMTPVLSSPSGSVHPPSPFMQHHLLQTGGQSAPPTDQSPAVGPLTPPTGAFAARIPTTQISLHAPDFSLKKKEKNAPNSSPNSPKPQMQTKTSPSSSSTSSTRTSATSNLSAPSIAQTRQSAASSSSSASSHSQPVGMSKGQIHVKLINGRGINVSSPHSRPYVVVQFEQNEFVSRDPTDEMDKEVKGTATNLSRTNSSNALSALSAIGTRPCGKLPNDVMNGAGSSAKGNSPTQTTLLQPPPSGTSSSFGRLSAHSPVWKHEVTFDVTSEESLISFNVYDRAVEEQGFLGMVQIKPILVHDHTVDQWYKLRPLEESENVTGEIRVQITFEQYKTKRTLTPRDFEFLKLIGRGTFGKVFQVRKRDTKRIYAMKVLSKKEIVAKKEVAHTIGERQILQRSLECPFLVGLKFSFQTDNDLYLVTDFKSGGELFWHLQKETRFSEERARFYIAELVLALEHLHKYNIVYRDLKPENILLDATGHVALCDFGLSKAGLQPDELTTTFCGTTEYLAPEVLLDEHGYSKLVDFWSLGVLLFEMCCGWSPFYAEDTQQMYKNICFGKIRFPRNVISEDGKMFVKGLLNRNPKHRLGARNDAAELKEHPFFATIDWTALLLKQVTPPFKPVVESDESTANFDPEFTTADVRDLGMDLDINLDEEDPSEKWTMSASVGGSGFAHTPNGPLGSERSQPLSPIELPTSVDATQSSSPSGSTSKGIEIGSKKKKREPASSPLTNSVQENFRGFTYSGGESVVTPMGVIGGQSGYADEEEAVLDEDGADEFDEEDAEGFAGRYAGRRNNGVDDDIA